MWSRPPTARARSASSSATPATASSIIHDLARQSKPGRRVYHKMQALPKVLNGLGIAVVSTSKGVMSDRQAREQNVGGELLCTVS